ncbi:hypothetical protein PIB30_091319 [Stylosanthes scabra]|uniref:Uncharacterized protein n=1 Tax=Stylosanthes scabra TaxID=79078 RepID=A0ABU6QVM4_9FABA|nr:hypothetical protein [Stylosanthes scabra]
MGEENQSVQGRRDPSILFAVEIACVCSVFGVGNKVDRTARFNQGTRSQRQTPTQTTTGDNETPQPEPDPMPWPPVDNPLPEGEEEDIAMEEELARQAGRVYLRWDGGNCWNKVSKGTTKISWFFWNYYRWFVPQFSMAPDHVVHFWWDRWRRGYEFKIYESWRMRASKRLRELKHKIRNKGVPHGWILEPS